jgi:hypothetical protein
MDRRTLFTGLGAGFAMSLAQPAAWATPNVGRWLRLESANFVMYSSASEESSREELAALEGFHALITRIMPRKSLSPAKLPIYVTRTNPDFDLTAPYFRNSMVMGYYSASVEGTVAVSKSLRYQPRQRDMPRNVRADDARVILFHEYTHHYVLANNRTGYPAWYIEGIAEFLSTVEFTTTGVDVGKFTQGRAYSLLRGDWLEIEKFLDRPNRMTGEEVAAFYAQAWLATHYMMLGRPERATGFDRYVKLLQDGGNVLTSFEPAFGITPAQFDKELREYKRKPIEFGPINGILPVEKGIQATRLASSYDNLLLPMVYLQRLPTAEKAKDTLGLVKEEVRRNKDDIDAQRAGAWVETWYGDLSEARKQIDAILAVNGDSAATHHVSGLCDLRAAYAASDVSLFERARKSFGRSHARDDTRASALFRYFESGLNATGTVDDHLIEVLIKAYQLAPQVDAIVATTAHALMARDRFDEAVIVLRPLAANPHGGKLSEKAVDWLASAKAKQKMDFAITGAARVVEGEEED